MNYLAHSYLSFGDAEILVGNMISDFVKGKRKFDYSRRILAGIMLHRGIDAYTDEHEATKEAKQFLRPAVGLYAGAFIDVVYDHFLAVDQIEFGDGSLYSHSQKTYSTLEQFEEELPEKFKTILPYMKSQNWLYNYREISGAEKSFMGLVRRAKYLDTSADAFQLFLKNYAWLQDCYNAFFPSVKAFAAHQFEALSG